MESEIQKKADATSVQSDRPCLIYLNNIANTWPRRLGKWYMMPARLVFEEHAGDYDAWFDEHNSVYQAQLRILRETVPDFQRGLEVGVGSGRFAAPLGIKFGIDPSQKLTVMAKHRGVEVNRGVAEHRRIVQVPLISS